MSARAAVGRVLEALREHGSRVEHRGPDAYMAQCPADGHDDRKASLSVAQGDVGAVVCCQAGCDTRDIVAALGLKWADLFDSPRKARDSAPRRVAAEYRYVDESGELLFVKVRYEPKDFGVKRPDGRGGWTYKLGDARRTLYRLPQVLAAIQGGKTVFLVEGEKDADRLAARGHAATCNFDGAAKEGQRPKWQPEYSNVLRGADVVIIADRDDPGIAHARAAAAGLAGKAKSVAIMQAAVDQPHADVSDHLDAGLGLGELVPVPPAAAAPTAPGEALKPARSHAGTPQLPEVETGTAPATIRALREAIGRGDIPGTYVSSGSVVAVEAISGTPAALAGDEDSPLPVTATVLSRAGLAALLARHTFTYVTKSRKAQGGGTETFEEEVTPPNQVLAAALEPKEWPDLRPLFGIVGAPVLRPDGTLLQEPGYDPATGLYLASKVPLDPVPEKPTARQVAAARSFLFGQFLGDFPWVSEADKANYIGVLATPVLRSYLRTLIPFTVITATTPASGKTILAAGLGMLYGQRVLTWTHSDDELRKAITSVLADPVGTIIFDNLAEGTVINSPVLARLITDRTWADRLLGRNATAAFANDRVWAATGNNLRLGGDMRSRSVLVALNPDTPRPEERTGFTIPGLDQWILMPANQRQVLWHLLVLIADWIGKGGDRRKGVTMRQFTPWAEAVGGFLEHHEVGGFLANASTVRDIDDEEAAWTAFYAQWRKLHADRWLTSNDLHLSSQSPLGTEHDPWDGTFIRDKRGRFPTVLTLGQQLGGQVGRWRGPFVLRSQADAHTKVKRWRVEEDSG